MVIKVVTIMKVNIGLKITATLPLAIMKFITVVIKVVTTVEVDIGFNKPYTLPLAIVAQELMLTL